MRLSQNDLNARVAQFSVVSAFDRSFLHFSNFLLLYTLMYNYLFLLVNSLFIVRGNKTRQGYVRKHTLKPAGYFFLAQNNNEVAVQPPAHNPFRSVQSARGYV